MLSARTMIVRPLITSRRQRSRSHFLVGDTDAEICSFRYLNDRLRIRPVSVSQANQVVNGASVVSLKDLEMILEEMTAAVYWSGELPSSGIERLSLSVYSLLAAHTPISMPFMFDAENQPLPAYMDLRVSNEDAQLNVRDFFLSLPPSH